MRNPSRRIEVDRVHSSSLLLAPFALAGAVMRPGTRLGFGLWEGLFSWASYPVFFIVLFAALGRAGDGVAAGAGPPGRAAR